MNCPRGLCPKKCLCEQCDYVQVYPELPSMDPPPLSEVWANPHALWTVACNYLGPIQDGRAVLVRRGLRTDGASIPRFAWRVIGHPFQLPLLAYALPHDGEYAAELFGRGISDSRLLDSMDADGHICWVKRNLVWSAVRVGGGFVWRKHTPGSVLEARKFVRMAGEEEYFEILATRSMPPWPAEGGGADGLQKR